MCWGRGLIGVPGRGGPGSPDLGGAGTFACCRGLLGVKLLGLGAIIGLLLPGGSWGRGCGSLEAMFGGP